MVGVPRSKGCRICVQRRVKCDQTRPTCNNCKKGNRPCPGYAQDLKFQDEGARLRKRFAQNGSSNPLDHDSGSSESPPDLSDSTTASGTPDFEHSHRGIQPIGQDSRHWDVVGLDMNKSQRRTFLGLLEGKSEQYTRMVQTNPELEFMYTAHIDDDPEPPDRFMFPYFGHSTDPFLQHIYSPELTQNQLVVNFRDSIAPNNGTVPEVFRNHANWLAHLPPLTGTNPLLDASVRAVTLVHIGRLNNSEPFVNESRPYYGRALRLLNSALQDRKKGMSNETLCATILLSFYEMFASDNNDSWVRHAGGVSALMKARGPRRHRHGFDREIFLAYRYTLIIEAFQEDVPCFLAEPGWLKVSSEIHADLISAGSSSGISPERAEIFDIAEEYYQSMVCLPELAANARTLWQAKQAGTPPPMSRAQVLEKLTQSRALFKSTFTRFEATLKKAGHAPTIQLNSKDPLISLDYEFINTFVSATYVGYWTVLIVLNLCLSGLQADDPDMVALYHTENRECSLNICRSCRFMLTSSFLGPFFLIFGLRVGLLVFEDAGGVECDWILRKLFDIGDRHMGIAKHVPGYRAGIGVDELLTEFKARKAKATKERNHHDRAEFARQVALGDLELSDVPSISIETGNGIDDDVLGTREDIGGMTSLSQRAREQQQKQRQRDQSNVASADATNNGFRNYNINNNSHTSAAFVSGAPFQGMTELDDVIQVWENQEIFNLNLSAPGGVTESSYPSSRAHSTTPIPPGADMDAQDQTGYFTEGAPSGHGGYQPNPIFADQGPQYLFAESSRNQAQRQPSPQRMQPRRQGSGRPWELSDVDLADLSADMDFDAQQNQTEPVRMGLDRFFN
ncbi:hypothetical protein H2198_001844 [Neophaeococcomyces mojaviensis]|uniref:Uncharacterized protein n=1 Tax=Neophaeococcomyces mojaviensis TaxID=3383035 RepID=A0ACC3AGH2_9EURO|nr:hypothetical protein H2198_001844 [Knufia sp. JES_112]